MADDDVTDPRDNPTADGHLPGPGEVGGPASYHDPVTQDTTDQNADVQPESDPTASDSEMPPTGAS